MTDDRSITTGAGGQTTSRLLDGTCLDKDHDVFEAMGRLDELTSHLGVVRATTSDAGVRRDLEDIQCVLVRIGSEVAAPPGGEAWHGLEHSDEADLEALERRRGQLLERTTMPRRFVLPGETLDSARIDVARAVCRSAERAVVRCSKAQGGEGLGAALRYLNRLSDYLFVLARHVEQHYGRSEQ